MILVSGSQKRRSLFLEGALQLDGPLGAISLSAVPGRLSLDFSGSFGPARAARALLLARRIRIGLRSFLDVLDTDIRVSVRGVEIVHVRETCDAVDKRKPRIETRWRNLFAVFAGLL